jgi:hypothetical protein
MRFTTREKIGACIGGGFFGFPLGIFILVKGCEIVDKPHKIEGPGAIYYGIAGGCLGVILGAKIMYEIVEHTEKKGAKERLLKKQKSKDQSKD